MVLRWGIVTAAKICHDFVTAFNSFPGKGDQIIAAIAARDRSRAEAFAKLHNIEKVFESYQALAESSDIDVAYIGALNPDHYALAKLFLENGKHVLCEKPLCLNFKQAESLIKLAKKKNLFLMEAVWSRFLPIYEAVEKEIKAGNIGEVQFVEASFGITIGGLDRLAKRDLGGGAILDLGIYILQFAQFIFKEEPIKVTAVGELNEDGVDLSDTVILEYSGGRRAVLNAHTKTRLINNATVYGTKGKITIKDPFHCPETYIKPDGTPVTLQFHSASHPYNFENSAGLVYESLEVMKCIKAGLIESPRMSHSESLILAKLEDNIRKQVGVKYDDDDKLFP